MSYVSASRSNSFVSKRQPFIDVTDEGRMLGREFIPATGVSHSRPDPVEYVYGRRAYQASQLREAWNNSHPYDQMP